MVKRLGTERQPSTARIRHMQKGVQARRSARDIRISQPVQSERQQVARRDEADKDFQKAQRIATGGTLALLAVAATIAAGAKGDAKPVDVTKVPSSELSRFIVPADGQSPELIAREVNNGETDLDVLTAEAEQQIGNDASTGEVIKFPTDQVDPAATRPLVPKK